MWRRLAQIVVVAALVTIGVSAAAQEGGAESKSQRAQKAFERGATLYEQERYAEAIVQFKKGYKLVPNPVIMYNIGNAQVRMGNYRDAAESAERALASDELQGEGRTKARALERCSRVLMEAETVAQRHGEQAGGPAVEESEQTAAATSPEGTGTDRAPGRGSTSPRLQTLGWLGIGAAGAGVGGVTASLLLADSISRDLDRLDELEHEPGSRDKFESKRSSIQSKQTAAKVLLFGGAGLGAVGATLLTVDLLQQPSDGSAPRATAGLTTDGALFLHVEW